MKNRSPYDNMTASDLARITRERGLEKPNVITLREWADFLEADDQQRRAAETEQAPVEAVEAESDEPSGDYNDWSAKALRREADERGLDTAHLRTKTELIDALEAADGVSEDEQADEDEGAG